MLQKIREILGSSFVFYEEVAEVLAVALAAGKNVILWGPGGHAKSAMVTQVVRGLGLEAETFVQSFGEGMDEARLWGGLDFKKLDTEKVLEFYPERSFLATNYAVFEELFDAPPSVLLSLKDTLTAGALRNGAQTFKMQTKSIIVCTNREPGELSQLGPAVAALVERFPLQLRVAWPSYMAKDYLAMYTKLPSALNGFTAILAEVLGKATGEGNIVSPRTAMHARDAVLGHAKARGAAHAEKEDLRVLRFVPGLEALGANIEADISAAMERAEAEKVLSALEFLFKSLESELQAAETPIKALIAAKKFGQLEDQLAKLKVPDAMTKRRNDLRELVTRRVSEAQKKALDTTRV